MGSREKGESSSHRRYTHSSPDAYSSRGRVLQSSYPTFETLPSRQEVMERKLSAQSVEVEKLVKENLRLHATHGVLRQDLAAAKQELQLINDHKVAFKDEKEQQIRAVMDKIERMESDISAGELIKLELRQALAEAQNLVASRQELILRLQKLGLEIEMAIVDSSQIAPLIVEHNGLRQEYQRCRASYDHEMKLYSEHLESLQVMEKSYMEKSAEVSKLREQLNKATNIDMRAGVPAQFNGNHDIWNTASGQNGYVPEQPGFQHLGGQTGHYHAGNAHNGTGWNYNTQWEASYGHPIGNKPMSNDPQNVHAAAGYHNFHMNYGPNFDPQKGQYVPSYNGQVVSTAPTHISQAETGYGAHMELVEAAQKGPC